MTMEVTGIRVEDGKLVAERPILGDSSVSTSRYKGKGIVIGRLNAFEAREGGGAAAVEKRIDPSTGRLDRSGEKNLNPYDTHAIEAAMQIKEGGAVPVEEIVAVTMGPESAVRALHKAVSLGADRSVHLSDAALAGSDVAATGYALAQVLKRESPDLVLLGQQSDDGECYTIGAVVAESPGTIIEDEDTDETVEKIVAWLDERKLI